MILLIKSKDSLLSIKNPMAFMMNSKKSSKFIQFNAKILNMNNLAIFYILIIIFKKIF